MQEQDADNKWPTRGQCGENENMREQHRTTCRLGTGETANLQKWRLCAAFSVTSANEVDVQGLQDTKRVSTCGRTIWIPKTPRLYQAFAKTPTYSNILQHIQRFQDYLPIISINFISVQVSKNSNCSLECDSSVRRSSLIHVASHFPSIKYLSNQYIRLSFLWRVLSRVYQEQCREKHPCL